MRFSDSLTKPLFLYKKGEKAQNVDNSTQGLFEFTCRLRPYFKGFFILSMSKGYDT